MPTDLSLLTRLFADNARSALAASLTDVGTSLTLETGDGARFPDPTDDAASPPAPLQYFIARLVAPEDVDDPDAVGEKIVVLARAGDVCGTIERAYDDTTAQAWPTGTVFELTWERVAAARAFNNTLRGLNYLLNPNWLFDQINEGALYTSIAGAVQCVDAWTMSAVAAVGIFKTRRFADPENAALKCLEITCTTADGTIAATDAYYLQTAVEGFDAAGLMIGTAIAKEITISFAFKSNVNGFYGVSLANSALNRSYVGGFTVADANEHIYSVTLTLDTSGTWLYDSGVGLRLRLCLAAGADFQKAAGSWGADNMLTTSAQVNFLSANTNKAFLKRIQLVEGASALPFAPQDYAKEVDRIMRYYEKSWAAGTAVGTVTLVNSQRFYADKTNSTQLGHNTYFMAAKRVVPTMTLANPNSGTANQVRNVTTAADLASAFGDETTRDGRVDVSVAGVNVGDNIAYHWTANARLT